ncbi:MAG: HEAT repeat domain-containing protein, partial [Deltaproteobacteria bacterium]|nr:HEAT repeat domain-containing protein [Deltaproteobacteria bacterium]
VLNGDASRDVRQAAAFALGRLGGSAAREALRSAQTTESDSLVRDAIEVALRMQ